MLRQRVISAIILAPLGIAAVMLLPHTGFNFLAMLIMGLGAWEWARLAGCQLPSIRIMFAIAALLTFFLVEYRFNEWHELLILTGALWWLLALGWLLSSPMQREPSRIAGMRNSLTAFLALVPAYIALSHLQAQAQYGLYLLLLLGLVWCADIAAYFSGKAFGKKKLAPTISPGKTWAGVFGGLAAVALYSVLCSLFLQLAFYDGLLFLLLCLVSGVFSIIGDLFISMLKRRRGIKDSSHLIPGHGGILDRFDSVIAASPIFASGMSYLV